MDTPSREKTERIAKISQKLMSIQVYFVNNDH